MNQSPTTPSGIHAMKRPMPRVAMTNSTHSPTHSAEPERADLPAEVPLEPRAAHLAPLRVIQDDGDDRGPAEEKGAHDGGGGDDADEQADGVERVDHVRQSNEGRARLDDGGHGSRLSRAPCETHARSRAARARRCRAPR